MVYIIGTMRVRRILGQALVAGWVCLAFQATGWAEPEAATRWVSRRVATGGEPLPYQVYLPEGWSPLTQWPVILFLHGLGERGQDGWQQTRVGLGRVISEGLRTVPAVVVAPQCRRGARWDTPEIERMVIEALEHTLAEFNGDASRVYLTGISMGGYATYYLGARHPGLFAALVPVSGGVLLPEEARLDPEADPAPAHLEMSRQIASIPIWIFHGHDDSVVPVAESRKMSRALTQAGARVRYTEYPATRHNAWDQAYAEDGLFTWMLSQRRSAPAVPPRRR